MKITLDKSFISGKFLLPYLPILDRYLIQELVPPFVFGVGLFSSVALTVGNGF